MHMKAICLLSTGFDSPVAISLMEKKGVNVIGIYFDNTPYIASSTKEANKNNILKKESEAVQLISQQLVNSFKKQTNFYLYILPHGKDLAKIISIQNKKRFTCVLCKRLMLKKAERLAKFEKANLIVTGDILGEQASQTSQNLTVISEALNQKTLVRPNIGLNKEEIMNIGKEIGTSKYSENASRFACTAVPAKPVTVIPRKKVFQIENLLPIEKMVEESFVDREKMVFTKR
ncbi:MAG: hypothetical protein U9O98_06070 [Asgard group archaeon]|nr:hypothetical protein [Asgard group archaeon]